MASQESIIEIIQRMVQEGQPREKIVQTLHDLGVNEDQAKRLLLIAEADTFTLLKKEINSLVKGEVLGQKKDFEDLIRHDIKLIEEEEKLAVQQVAKTQLKDVEESIIKESRDFEDRINKVINESQKTVSLVKVALDSLNNRLAQMEIDVEQLKLHKFRKRSMFFSYAMLALGAVTLFVATGLLWVRFDTLDMAQIVVIAVLILASITLMFASVIG
jgi:phosphotransferase system IIA component